MMAEQKPISGFRKVWAVTLLMAVAACASSVPAGVPSGRYPDNDELPKGDQGVKRKIGNPYKVAGNWYYPKEDPSYDEIGVASWYGKDFHGKKTANGEYFNMNALTAAHKTLPLPTFVKVTNISNGRSLVLRVNDRGPFVSTRLIDVSRRAAQLLGFQKQGVTRVRIQAVDEDGKLPSKRGRKRRVRRAEAGPQSPVARVPQQAAVTSAPLSSNNLASADLPSPTALISNRTHYIQVGSFGQRRNAEVQVGKLRQSGHRARIEQSKSAGRTLWRVRVGPFVEQLIAEARLARIVSAGFADARIFKETIE